MSRQQHAVLARRVPGPGAVLRRAEAEAARRVLHPVAVAVGRAARHQAAHQHCHHQLQCHNLFIHRTHHRRKHQDNIYSLLCSAADDPSVSQSVYTITEKAPTRAFSWLKAPPRSFPLKTLLRHYAKRALTHSK